MPSTSKAQRKIMGAAYHCKKTGECASEKIKKIADSMSKKSLRDFAKTKEEGLPEKKHSYHKKESFMTFGDFLLLKEAKNHQHKCRCECKPCKEGNCKNCNCEDCDCKGCTCKN
jgi:hypothetical protein